MTRFPRRYWVLGIVMFFVAPFSIWEVLPEAYDIGAPGGDHRLLMFLYDSPALLGAVYLVVLAIWMALELDWGSPLGLVALGLAVLAVWGALSADTLMDVAGSPAIARGQVSDRHTDSYTGPRNFSTFRSYYLKIAGVEYVVSSGIYRDTSESGCYVLAYAPHQRVATSVSPC